MVGLLMAPPFNQAKAYEHTSCPELQEFHLAQPKFIEKSEQKLTKFLFDSFLTGAYCDGDGAGDWGQNLEKACEQVYLTKLQSIHNHSWTADFVCTDKLSARAGLYTNLSGRYQILESTVQYGCRQSLAKTA